MENVKQLLELGSGLVFCLTTAGNELRQQCCSSIGHHNHGHSPDPLAPRITMAIP
jgi:hypothetical protein